jgi:hypothetical protein
MNKYQKHADDLGDTFVNVQQGRDTLGGGVLGSSVCALTTKARRLSAGRDRAPMRPTEAAGKTAPPAKELMAITIAICARRIEEGTEVLVSTNRLDEFTN